MKRNGWKVAMLALLACASAAQAAGPVTTRNASAAMDIGLRIVETCAIQTGAATGATVACQHNSPYLIESTAPAQASAPGVLTVAF